MKDHRYISTHQPTTYRIYYNLALSPSLALSSSNSLTNPLAIHSQIPILVTIGFTPLALGNTLASATYNPSVPQTLPCESTTPRLA